MSYRIIWLLGVSVFLFLSGECLGVTSSVTQEAPEKVEDLLTRACRAVQQGSRLAREGKFEQALEQYQQALEGFHQAGERQGYADAASDKAVIYRKVGDFERSLTLQRQAETLYEDLGDVRGQAKALRRIGVVSRHKGDFLYAIAVQEESLKLLEQLQDQQEIAMILTNLGTIYGDLGRFQDARSYFEQALALYTELQHQQGVSYIFGNLGQLLLYLGDSQQALDYLEQSLAIKQTLADTQGQANTLLNIGTAYRNLGDFQKALAFYYQALELYQSLNDRYGEAVTLGNIGSIYEELGDIDRALQFQMQSFELKKINKIPIQLSVALTDLASLAIKQQRFDEAYSSLQEGLELADEQSSPLAQAHIYGQLGVLFLEQQRFDEALQHFTKALNLYENAGSRKGILEVFDYIGQTYLGSGIPQRAIEYYEQALQLAEELNDSNSLWKIQYRLAQIAIIQGNEATAEKHLVASIETLEHMRSYLKVPELRQLILQKDLNPYAQLIRLLLSKNEIKEALIYLERFKARTFLEVVTHEAPQMRAIPALLREEQYVAARIRYLQDKLVSLGEYGKQGSIVSADTGEALKGVEYISQELYRAKEQYEQVLLQIKLKYPEYYRLKTVDADEIRQLVEDALALLEEDVVILEYFLDEEALHIWVLEKHQIHHTSLPISRRDVVERVLTLRTEIRQYFSTAIYPHLHELYTWLVAPVEDHLTDKHTIGVVPFQALHFVPFSALLRSPWTLAEQEQSRFPEYMIDTYAMFVLPSLSLLPAVRERKEQRLGENDKRLGSYFLGIGNATKNLPGAEQEILTIARQFPDSIGYLGEEATKQRLFDEAGQYEIVHLATHGVYDTQHPMFSYLELFSESLYARDIFGLNLGITSLVTLSGCETLLPQQVQEEDIGSLVNGDELVGFIRAFMYAGTPTVLSSLWRVNDAATHYLMSAFYQHLPRLGKAKALQKASQTVIRSSLQVGRRRKREIPLIHPFFWSSFVLMGDWK